MHALFPIRLNLLSSCPGKQQLKNLQNALDCLLECYKSLEHFPKQCSFSAGDSSGQLLPVLVHRLQTVLKQLVALCMKRR